MDIWDYFRQREAEIRRRCGAPPDRERYAEDSGSDGSRGVVDVVVSLRLDAYLKIYERVEIVAGRRIHRYRYCYTLIVGGSHVHRWERDPTHHAMPVHEHVGPRGDARPGRPVLLEQVMEAAWEILSER